jgi:hypothetical protein
MATVDEVGQTTGFSSAALPRISIAVAPPSDGGVWIDFW